MIDLRKYVEIVSGTGGADAMPWIPPVFEFPGGFSLLLEGGGPLLLETGEPILLETTDDG